MMWFCSLPRLILTNVSRLYQQTAVEKDMVCVRTEVTWLEQSDTDNSCENNIKKKRKNPKQSSGAETCKNTDIIHSVCTHDFTQ